MRKAYHEIAQPLDKDDCVRYQPTVLTAVRKMCSLLCHLELMLIVPRSEEKLEKILQIPSTLRIGSLRNCRL